MLEKQLTKLTIKDLTKCFSKLGYQPPKILKKAELLNKLSIDIGNTKQFYNNIPDDQYTEHIISLDMGLKNMSLSRFTIESNKSKPTKSKPVLQQWFKIDLEPYDEYQFSPVNYSLITDGFLREYLLPKKFQDNNVYTVIAERQRFRTNGSPRVLETTLKSNTVEAMLAMGLITHNRLSPGNRISFHSSAPGAMVNYWQSKYYYDESMDKVKISEKDSKNFRIDLALSMLHDALNTAGINSEKANLNESIVDKLRTRNQHGFEIPNGLVKNFDKRCKKSEFVESWEKAWEYKSKSRRLWEVSRLLNLCNKDEYKVPDLDKLWGKVKGDDLADSLLHGLQYFDHLQNRKIFIDMISKDKSDMQEFLED